MSKQNVVIPRNPKDRKDAQIKYNRDKWQGKTRIFNRYLDIWNFLGAFFEKNVAKIVPFAGRHLRL